MEKKVDTIVRYSPTAIPKIMRSHWRAKPKEPFHLVGEPSTVKSQGVYMESRAIAKDEGREFFNWNRSSLEQKHQALATPEKFFVFADIRASETDIGELRLQDLKDGMPYITFKYNILFEALSKQGAMGVLFFDEMNLAPNMIKAQFYKIINDRAVGDIPISDDVLCVSAGNEAEHARGVTEDPVPLVLRRGNYFVRPLTAEEYLDFAVKDGHHQFVTGYLSFQPQDVHQVRYDLPDGVGQPCARTWTKLSNMLHANASLSVDDVEMLATGLVGQGAATKFSAYVRSAKKVDLDAVIKNPELINEFTDEKEISLAYAIIAGVVERFRTDKKVIKPAFEMACHINRVELGAYLLRCLKNLDENKFRRAGGTDKLIDDDLMNKTVEKYGKYLFRAD